VKLVCLKTNFTIVRCFVRRVFSLHQHFVQKNKSFKKIKLPHRVFALCDLNANEEALNSRILNCEIKIFKDISINV